jgi:hypothetical protein
MLVAFVVPSGVGGLEIPMWAAQNRRGGHFDEILVGILGIFGIK